ncbi:MAG: DUF4430 domain-containing protein [bacterium]|nr:DUF4430 domain-containing protein [bacterium]
MKALSIAIVITALSLPPVFAQSGITVFVRIETPELTIFSGNVMVSDCVVIDREGKKHYFKNYEAVCALDAAAESGDLTYTVDDQHIGLYLYDVAGHQEDAFHYWFYWVNYDLAPVGIDNYDLSAGDNILFALTDWESRPLELELPDEAIIGEIVTVETLSRNYANHNFDPEPGVTVFVDGIESVSSSEGLLELSFSEAGTVSFVGEKEFFVRSPRHTLTVTAPPVPPEQDVEEPIGESAPLPADPVSEQPPQPKPSVEDQPSIDPPQPPALIQNPKPVNPEPQAQEPPSAPNPPKKPAPTPLIPETATQPEVKGNEIAIILPPAASPKERIPVESPEPQSVEIITERRSVQLASEWNFDTDWPKTFVYYFPALVTALAALIVLKVRG